MKPSVRGSSAHARYVAEIERQYQERVDPPRHDPVAQADRNRNQRRPQDQRVPEKDDSCDPVVADLVEENQTGRTRNGQDGHELI